MRRRSSDAKPSFEEFSLFLGKRSAWRAEPLEPLVESDRGLDGKFSRSPEELGF